MKSHFRRFIDEQTRLYLIDAMARNQGNVSAVSRDTGINRQDLYKKLRKHDLMPKRVISRNPLIPSAQFSRFLGAMSKETRN